MRVPVDEALHRLEGRCVVSFFKHDHSAKVIPYVQALIGRPLPPDLEAFYRANVASIVEYNAIAPAWSDYVGWRTPDALVTELLPVNAIPLFYDGCGNKFALDLTPGVDTPAVYFFEHEDGFERPHWAAGSSLGAFLLVAADDDRAFDEKWPKKWELTIDPDIDKCPRAPAIWAAR